MWHELTWNDENEAHIARHRVTPDEVHQVLNSDPRVFRPGRDGTRLVFGTTYTGRYLLVGLADAPDGRDLVVTARDMDRAEKTSFQRKART